MASEEPARLYSVVSPTDRTTHLHEGVVVSPTDRTTHLHEGVVVDDAHVLCDGEAAAQREFVWRHLLSTAGVLPQTEAEREAKMQEGLGVRAHLHEGVVVDDCKQRQRSQGPTVACFDQIPSL